MSHNEPSACCACLRVVYKPIPERFYVRGDDVTPGGWKDGFRESWACAACGTEFMRRLPVQALREEARGLAYQEMRRALSRLANWAYSGTSPDYPSNVLDRVGNWLLEMEAGWMWLDRKTGDGE